MAGSSNVRRVSLVVVLFMFLVVNAQGRAHAGKWIDGRLLLHQLCYGDGAVPSFVERASTMDADMTRLAPEGPVPRHHIVNPSALREP
ncbi:hypothetical protein NL676_000961 [Syzygium grande]|nr:hypothetical protein NL676_000961 [Syzygium grande]